MSIETLLIVGFVSLFCTVALWLLLCYKLFKRLERDHPEKFVAMGSPDLGDNNTLKANINLFKFLYHREWVALNDPELASRAGFMRKLMLGLFITFTLIFLSAPILATRLS
jgi:hypothetical protein